MPFFALWTWSLVSLWHHMLRRLLWLKVLGYNQLLPWWTSSGPWALYESWQALVDNCSSSFFIFISPAFTSLTFICSPLFQRCQQLTNGSQPKLVVLPHPRNRSSLNFSSYLVGVDHLNLQVCLCRCLPNLDSVRRSRRWWWWK